MASYPDLYVLRHGETEWNHQRRWQGVLDSPLTPRGLEQAAAQGHLLARLLPEGAPSAWCSPQLRARRTAEIALSFLGGTAEPDARLGEVSVGQAAGMLQSDIAARWPGFAPDVDHPFGWYFRVPGSESFDALRHRCQQFLDSLNGPAIVVTHGITGRMIRALWLGLDIHGMHALPGGQGCVFQLQKNGEITHSLKE
ncbi:histidine phosphatase family protein [Candidatus Halocynthiibacter alkanivorans]|uniref:histidine phosphatase family protein n=1 Tax=Candidatus Halocynthiibacter alkanivorans TaxID=2267619 RepID=UPI000DF4992D|nr:histidine phosphatase family protein [Candidatus Halocynthiibacter alkanivorans]